MEPAFLRANVTVIPAGVGPTVTNVRPSLDVCTADALKMLLNANVMMGTGVRFVKSLFAVKGAILRM